MLEDDARVPKHVGKHRLSCVDYVLDYLRYMKKKERDVYLKDSVFWQNIINPYLNKYSYCF